MGDIADCWRNPFDAYRVLSHFQGNSLKGTAYQPRSAGRACYRTGDERHFDIVSWWLRQPEDYPISNVERLLDKFVIQVYRKPSDIDLV